VCAQERGPSPYIYRQGGGLLRGSKCAKTPGIATIDQSGDDTWRVEISRTNVSSTFLGFDQTLGAMCHLVFSPGGWQVGPEDTPPCMPSFLAIKLALESMWCPCGDTWFVELASLGLMTSVIQENPMWHPLIGWAWSAWIKDLCFCSPF
jgi:hypothetical protein